MERNYKPNKNTKLQNLFLCQKKILSINALLSGLTFYFELSLNLLNL